LLLSARRLCAGGVIFTIVMQEVVAQQFSRAVSFVTAQATRLRAGEVRRSVAAAARVARR
jgi:hypothetical protein